MRSGTSLVSNRRGSVHRLPLGGLVLILTAMIILSGLVITPGKASEENYRWISEDTRAAKKWSVFVYMAADNDLEDVGIADFNEMEMIGSDSNLNIVVQFDRRPGGDSSNGNWNDTRRFLVEQDYDPQNIATLPLNDTMGERDMSDPGTLKEFLIWGVESFPAERYMLVLWDHGNGLFRRSMGGDDDDPTRGLCQDWTGGSDLEIWEISSVLSDLNASHSLHFDIIAADVCYFAYLETAYEFRKYTDYMIGSSDEEPAPGWDYERALASISENPTSSTRDVAIKIVERYLEQYDKSYLTMMALDIGIMENLLLDTFTDLAEMLISDMYEHQGSIRNARTRANSPKSNYKDLYSFAKALTDSRSSLPLALTQRAQEFRTVLESAIIASGTGSQHPTSKGLAVWFPSNFQGTSYRTKYKQNFDFSELNWDEFLAEFDEPTEISITHEPLEDTEDLDGPYTFQARINAPEGTIVGVDLNYSIDGSSFQSIAFSEQGGLYTAEIDAALNNTRVYYYITLYLDDNSTFTDPRNAQPEVNETLHTFWVGLDKTPPCITHFPKEFIKDLQEPYIVTATIMDTMGIDTNNTHIYYKLNDTGAGTPAVEVDMLENQYPEYSGSIPPQPNGTDVYYWIEATDSSISGNNARSPMTGYYHSRFVNTKKRILIDNFHGNSLNYTILTDEYLLESYDIELLDDAGIKYALNRNDLFITASPFVEYSPLELSEISQFLNEGKSVLIVGPGSLNATEPLLDLANMSWSEEGSFSGGTTDLVNHDTGNFEYVDNVYYSNHTRFIRGGDSHILSTKGTAGDLSSFSEVGYGRFSVVIEGILEDDNILAEYQDQILDNFQFGRGLMHLLLDNRPPIPVMDVEENLEAENVLEVGFPYTFTSAGSMDPDGNLINYTWLLDGKVMGYGSKVKHTFDELGRYTVSLYVKDSEEESVHISQDFYTNLPPKASFIAAINASGPLNLSSGYVDIPGGQPVEFQSTSEDIGGSIVNTKWDFGDGTKVSQNKTSVIHTFKSKGEFKTVLSVWDNYGMKSTFSIYFSVSNAPPVVKISVPGRGQEDESIFMSLYDSFDPDDESEIFYQNIVWDFGDGSVQNYSLDASHTYYKSGTYNITVWITDLDLDDPRVGSVVSPITIYNKVPSAEANYTSKKGSTIVFTAKNSTDTPSDQPILKYRWDFDDGKTGEGMEVEHKFKRDGNFTVVLTVTDDDMANDTAVLLVSISSEKEFTINYYALGLFIFLGLLLIFIWIYPRFRKKGEEKEEDRVEQVDEEPEEDGSEVEPEVDEPGEKNPADEEPKKKAAPAPPRKRPRKPAVKKVRKPKPPAPKKEEG